MRALIWSKSAWLERFEWLEDGVGVRVLGLEVLDDLRIFLLAEPIERIDARVAECGVFDGSLFGVGRVGRGHGVILRQEARVAAQQLAFAGDGTTADEGVLRR